MSNFFHHIFSKIGAVIISIGLVFTGGNSAKIQSTSTPQSTSTIEISQQKENKIDSVIRSNATNDFKKSEPLSGTCYSSQSPVFTNQNLTWIAYPSGGSGNYSYIWSGDNNLSGNSASISWKYNTEGRMSAKVLISSGDKSISVKCGNDVLVSNGEVETKVNIQPSVSTPNLNDYKASQAKILEDQMQTLINNFNQINDDYNSKINSIDVQIAQVKAQYYSAIQNTTHAGDTVDYGYGLSINTYNDSMAKLGQLQAQRDLIMAEWKTKADNFKSQYQSLNQQLTQLINS